MFPESIKLMFKKVGLRLWNINIFPPMTVLFNIIMGLEDVLILGLAIFHVDAGRDFKGLESSAEAAMRVP